MCTVNHGHPQVGHLTFFSVRLLCRRVSRPANSLLMIVVCAGPTSAYLPTAACPLCCLSNLATRSARAATIVMEPAMLACSPNSAYPAQHSAHLFVSDAAFAQLWIQSLLRAKKFLKTVLRCHE